MSGPAGVLSLSVDCDAPLDYHRFYRRSARPSSDAFLDSTLPRLLEILDRLALPATFFWIGRDAVSETGRRWVRALVEAGHEIANHTFDHPPGFRHLSRLRRKEEIERADQALTAATGRSIVGFRAPAYDIDPVTVELLLERGYRYDSSLNPSPFLWGMKWIVRFRARRWRVGLGRMRHGLSSPSPHPYWLEGDTLRSRGPTPSGAPWLLEIPLSVLPVSRFPFYGTMTQILGPGFAEKGRDRLRRAARPIVYSLHLAELASNEELGSVPGYRSPRGRRVELLERSLSSLARDARGLTLAELAAEWERERKQESAA